MAEQVIKVTIHEDSTFEVKVNGVKGRACKLLTQPITDMGEVESQTLTSEYHETQAVRSRQTTEN